VINIEFANTKEHSIGRNKKHAYTTLFIENKLLINAAISKVYKNHGDSDSSKGDFIGVRHKMFLPHSYDHRVVDGALGGMFVRRVADYLEAFDKNRTI
jgi:hypothetical protein